jgi:glyoxylase I family protein
MKSLTVLLIAIFIFIGTGQTASGMEKVTGIGGFFFKAKDPQTLAKWYEANLGVNLTPKSYTEPPWEQQSGPTVFEPFPENTTYFGSKHWMLNFRVNDLNAMVKQLQSRGIKVDVDPQVYPNGVFAQLTDPEGNPIQLWEPKADPGTKPVP